MLSNARYFGLHTMRVIHGFLAARELDHNSENMCCFLTRMSVISRWCYFHGKHLKVGRHVLDWNNKIVENTMLPLCLGLAFLLTSCPKNKSEQKSRRCLYACLYVPEGRKYWKRSAPVPAAVTVIIDSYFAFPASLSDATQFPALVSWDFLSKNGPSAWVSPLIV